jgi:hypothetical protein
MKQIAVGTLVKPFAVAAATRTEATPFIPSVDDFKECSSGSELIGLVGSGPNTINELEDSPISFWLHPHLLGDYITSRQVKVESIGNSFVLAIEGMNDADAKLLTAQYHKFLIYIWAVANGYANRTTIKLLEPP